MFRSPSTRYLRASSHENFLSSSRRQDIYELNIPKVVMLKTFTNFHVIPEKCALVFQPRWAAGIEQLITILQTTTRYRNFYIPDWPYAGVQVTKRVSRNPDNNHIHPLGTISLSNYYPSSAAPKTRHEPLQNELIEWEYRIFSHSRWCIRWLLFCF